MYEESIKPSSKLEKLKIILRMFFPSFLRIVIIFITLMILTYCLKKCDNIIFINKTSIILNLIEMSQSLLITLLGIIIAGYSIFQALLDGESLKFLLERKDKKTGISKFKLGNVYFYLLSILNFGFIIFNGFLVMFIKSPIFKAIKKEISPIILNRIFILFLYLYLIFLCTILLDFKSFIKNLYDMFKINAFKKANATQSTQEKILLINQILFEEGKIDTINQCLDEKTNSILKSILKKENYTLNEVLSSLKNKEIFK